MRDVRYGWKAAAHPFVLTKLVRIVNKVGREAAAHPI